MSFLIEIARLLPICYSYQGTFGTIWLDIEGEQYWGSDQARNRAFFEGLVKEGRALGQVDMESFVSFL